MARPEAGRNALGWLTARPIAHRGYHDRAAGRIENTASAFAAAIDHNFSIECDVRLTADEEVIVFHDDRLDRLTDGGGQPERLSLSILRALNVNGTTDRIPTLRELLDLVAGRVPVVIELKSLWTGDRRLEREVADILADYSGPVAVMSFDPASLRAMRAYLPHVPRGMLGDRFDEASGWEKIPALYRIALRNFLMAPAVAPQFLAYDVKALPANAPLFIRHSFGLPLLTWTVRTPEERAVAARWADQVIFETFDPDR